MLQLKVNGKQHTLDIDPDTPLLWALRDHLNLCGTKYGCGIGLCGHCQLRELFVCVDGPVFGYDRIERLLWLREV